MTAPGTALWHLPGHPWEGDRDAVSPSEPGDTEVQVKTATCGFVSWLSVGQQQQCVQLELQRGKSSPCQSQGEKGDFFFFFLLTSFGVLISIFGNVYPLL